MREIRVVIVANRYFFRGLQVEFSGQVLQLSYLDLSMPPPSFQFIVMLWCFTRPPPACKRESKQTIPLQPPPPWFKYLVLLGSRLQLFIFKNAIFFRANGPLEIANVSESVRQWVSKKFGNCSKSPVSKTVGIREKRERNWNMELEHGIGTWNLKVGTL